MRYAIISDIHGNDTALVAVMKDIEKRDIDRIICLGDTISKGPSGHECVSIVKSNVDASVKGNCDELYTKSLDEIAEAGLKVDYDYYYWVQKQLSLDDINYLRNLPMCCEFTLSGRLVRCFHSSPECVDGKIVCFDNYLEKEKLFHPTQFTTNKRADVVVYGHTHNMSYEKMFGRVLINAGSVGNALNLVEHDNFNSESMGKMTMAEYVILSGEESSEFGEINVEFISVPYNKDEIIAKVTNKETKEVYENEIRFGKYRNPNRIQSLLTK